MNPLRPRPSPLLNRLLLAFSHGARPTAVATIPGARHASTEAVLPAAVAATVSTVPAVQGEAQQTQKQGGRRSRAIPPPGHGERIWIYNHLTANYIVYSLTPEMNSTKAFRQFAYTGKKLVPAKLRRDYWRPMAVVQFPAGRGAVGRSVFQKLRELRQRHLLEWDRGEAEDGAALLNMTRRERGKALNDQRGNAVADLAAVLAGRGKGNLVVVGDEEVELKGLGKGKGKGAGRKGGLVKGKEGEGEKGKKTDALQPATVYWANEQDKYFVEAWTENVTHMIGLPASAKAEPVVDSEAVPEVAQAAA